ncbi:MAG: class I SAM-dependent methyltransferase [Actinobacteria bacterium]|nr:class I SAM-dependent methyltransferase [Actinomycetota bacterium]
MNTTAQRWRDYLAVYHDNRPAITERLLSLASSSAYEWLVEPVRAETRPILDLACGSAPTRPLLPGARWIGLDSSAGELGYATAAGRTPLVRGNADALPIATNSVAAVCAALCFQVLTPLDAVLSEMRRVLRPGGMVVALVPARPGLRPAGLLRWNHILRALGVRRLEWPNPQATNGLARTLRQHGFRTRSNQRREFTIAIRTDEDLELLVDGLYLPDLPTSRLHSAKNTLRPWVRSGRFLPLPLRRVISVVIA